MLDHLVKLDNKYIPLQILGGKCALLMLLSTMCRIGEITQLKLLNIKPSPDGSSVTFHLSQPTKTFNFDTLSKLQLQRLTIRHQPSNQAICPVSTLKDYISYSQTFRLGCDQLFILPGDKRGPAARQTIVRWIKDLFRTAGLDQFTVHSTRASAATNALLMGMSVDQIVAKVGWLSPSTFVKTYMRPLSKFKNILAPLLPTSQIFPASQPTSHDMVKVRPPDGHNTVRRKSQTTSKATGHNKGLQFLELWKADKRFKIKTDPMKVRAKSFIKSQSKKCQPLARRAVKKAIHTLTDSSPFPDHTRLPSDRLNLNQDKETGSISTHSSDFKSGPKPTKHLISILKRPVNADSKLNLLNMTTTLPGSLPLTRKNPSPVPLLDLIPAISFPANTPPLASTPTPLSVEEETPLTLDDIMDTSFMRENFQDLDLHSINVDSFMNFLDSKKENTLHVLDNKLKGNEVKQQHVTDGLKIQDIPITSVPMPSLNKSPDIKLKNLTKINDVVSENIQWDKHKVHNFTNINQKTIKRNHPVLLQDPIPWPPPRKLKTLKKNRTRTSDVKTTVGTPLPHVNPKLSQTTPLMIQKNVPPSFKINVHPTVVPHQPLAVNIPLLPLQSVQLQKLGARTVTVQQILPTTTDTTQVTPSPKVQLGMAPLHHNLSLLADPISSLQGVCDHTKIQPSQNRPKGPGFQLLAQHSGNPPQAP